MLLRLCFSFMVYHRVCGGNFPVFLSIFLAAGLSPRVRGKRRVTNPFHTSRRSITACAGETVLHSGSRDKGKVYHRVCGGNAMIEGPSRTTPGLSPRVRGKLYFKSNVSIFTGSITACAGETFTLSVFFVFLSVYHRVCGGNVLSLLIVLVLMGLSPRVRGKQTTVNRSTKITRSITACAGETAEAKSDIVLKEVYHRVCGGNSLCSDLSSSDRGLSPRVRGKP